MKISAYYFYFINFRLICSILYFIHFVTFVFTAILFYSFWEKSQVELTFWVLFPFPFALFIILFPP